VTTNTAFILPVVAVCLIFLQFLFPLRSFAQKAQWRNLLFHAFFAAIVLVEVKFLSEGSLFPTKPLLSFFVGYPLVDILLCLILLDLFSYFWHRLNHRIRFFWYFHSFHHKANTLDPLAAYRFHPAEVFMGYQLRAFFVWILGFQKEGLEFFVIAYGVLNLYQHSNFQVPSFLEKIFSKVFVTPALHHVHHLKNPQFQNSNYSTIFIFWDHLFKSFHPAQKIQNDDLGLAKLENLRQ
jgi:sterol desaturase/sphingolipid hydroxylase (fatty acid hydroxylase superfamily)